MKALLLDAKKGLVVLEEVQEPQITAPHEVKMRVVEVGICGTDKEEVSGTYLLPENKPKFILGHEMMGQVVQVGSAVKKFRVGDLAVFTVRRGCSLCLSCKMGRFDLCTTGKYRERGIKGAEGFQSEFVVDLEENGVILAPEMRPFGVLSEPMSVVEKGVDVAFKLQLGREIPGWDDEASFRGKKVLVIGLGPIGLLGGLVLALRGADLYGMDLLEATSKKVTLFQKLKGSYFQLGKKTPPLEEFSLIFNAVGSAKASFDSFKYLAKNGVYVAAGVPPAHQQVDVDGGEVLRSLVLGNQALVGSVNADKKHWERGVVDLKAGEEKYGKFCSELITKRWNKEEAVNAFKAPSKESIKETIFWD